MNPILKQVLVPAVSAIAGGLIVLGAIKFSPTISSKNNESRPRMQNIEAIYDPFQQMRNMHGRSADLFDSWFSHGFEGGPINDISKREDDDSVYYDIKVENLKLTSINTTVENGYITITGNAEKRSGSSEEREENSFLTESIYKSTFNRTFPLPEHVDQNKMQMISEKDKIILKFPKIKTS